MRYHFTALMLSAMFTATAVAQQATPIAMSIGSPMLEEMDFSFRPHNASAGVTVNILVNGLDKPIVKLVDDASTVTAATDSTGKDLLEKPEPKEQNGFFMSSGSSNIGSFPRISDDGTQMLVELTMPQTPAADATSVKIDATLAVLVAAGQDTVSSGKIALAPGPITLGEDSIEIASVGKSEWQEGKTELTMKLSTKLLDKIAAWRLVGEDGEVLSDGPNSTMTMNNAAEVGLTYDGEPAAATLELDLYNGLEQIELPVQLELGLGL